MMSQSIATFSDQTDTYVGTFRDMTSAFLADSRKFEDVLQDLDQNSTPCSEQYTVQIGNAYTIFHRLIYRVQLFCSYVRERDLQKDSCVRQILDSMKSVLVLGSMDLEQRENRFLDENPVYDQALFAGEAAPIFESFSSKPMAISVHDPDQSLLCAAPLSV